MVYGLRDGIFFRLLYHHIVLCIDLFLTSHEEGNFNLVPGVSHLPAQAREERGLSSLAWGNFWQICRLFEVFLDAKRNINIIYLIFL